MKRKRNENNLGRPILNAEDERCMCYMRSHGGLLQRFLGLSSPVVDSCGVNQPTVNQVESHADRARVGGAAAVIPALALLDVGQRQLSLVMLLLAASAVAVVVAHHDGANCGVHVGLAFRHQTPRAVVPN